MKKNIIGFVCFGEINTPIERLQMKHDEALAVLQKTVDGVVDGGLVIDFTARIVYIDGKRIDMSPKEYDLFFYMLENPNVAISRERFISDVWGYDFYGDVRTLDTHIKLLRKSLGEYAKQIVTLRWVGYRFEA